MKLSELLFLEVVDVRGKSLGHVLDLRCEPKPASNEADIRELVYGYGGLLERLGLKRLTRERIAWQSVLRIENDSVIIKSD
jgi:sporulation protein YlmC with PRC-barrel domain